MGDDAEVGRDPGTATCDPMIGLLARHQETALTPYGQPCTRPRRATSCSCREGRMKIQLVVGLAIISFVAGCTSLPPQPKVPPMSAEEAAVFDAPATAQIQLTTHQVANFDHNHEEDGERFCTYLKGATYPKTKANEILLQDAVKNKAWRLASARRANCSMSDFSFESQKLPPGDYIVATIEFCAALSPWGGRMRYYPCKVYYKEVALTENQTLDVRLAATDKSIELPQRGVGY